jgi:hypothetical protein
MALSSSIVWEIQPGIGASTNGGGFVTGATGTDYSQQASPQWEFVGVTTAGVDAILLHADAAATMIGNVANIISGTNFTAGRYEILSVVAGVSITLDRDCATGAGSDGVVKIGGAVASLKTIATTIVPGNKVYQKSTGTTDTFGSATTFTVGTYDLPILVEGYNLTRGDLSALSYADSHTSDGFLIVTNYPTIAGATYTHVFGAYTFLYCLSLTSEKTNQGWGLGVSHRVKVINSANNASAYAASANGMSLFDCEFYSSGAASYCAFSTLNVSQAVGCRFGSAAGHGVIDAYGWTYVNCTFYSIASGKAGIIVLDYRRSNTFVGCTFFNCDSGYKSAAGVTMTGYPTFINCQGTGCTTAFANNVSDGPIPIRAVGNRLRNNGADYVGFIQSPASVGDISTAQTDAYEYVNPTASPPNLNLKPAGAGVGKGFGYSDIGSAQKKESIKLIGFSGGLNE